MSRFNTQSQGTKTTNLAGGDAFTQSAELELVSILITSMMKDEYYRSANSTVERLKTLIPHCDPIFVAKAAVFARTVFGMRSVSHVVASELASVISGKEWAKDFYRAIVYRPDDMMEILSYHKSKKDKVTNAMKKGFALAFDKFDSYSLGKYRGEGKGVKLIDVVNLVHPVPVAGNSEAIRGLVKGELRSVDTWEVELTKAGQNATNEAAKASLKRNVWVKLIRERKLGYFALLRNLRNILEQAPDMIEEACAMLTDESLIKKSLVLPFRYVTALEQFSNTPNATKIILALNKAVDTACANVPVFSGKTLVVCDYSGSMGDGFNSHKHKGSLFASVFAKKNECDFMIFGDRASYVSYNPMDSVLTITQSMCSNNKNGWGHVGTGVQVGHGTNFHSIFQEASSAYDRVIIFSDMQGWVGRTAPTSSFNEYKKRFNCNPSIYSFDLAGYGSLQFPERNVFCLAGLSEKVFDLMALLEKEKDALINAVNTIEF